MALIKKNKSMKIYIVVLTDTDENNVLAAGLIERDFKSHKVRDGVYFVLTDKDAGDVANSIEICDHETSNTGGVYSINGEIAGYDRGSLWLWLNRAQAKAKAKL